MTDEMSIQQIPLTIIVAATSKNGIGKGGGLPWPMLKKEMAYFARVTKRVPLDNDAQASLSNATKPTSNDARRNAVIMGRKTWESIPPKFRPLRDRTNIVISSQDRANLESLPEEVITASSIASSMTVLMGMAANGKAPPLGRVFVIGGSSIYKAALDLQQTRHVLLTRIQRDYECDTFFPEALESQRAIGASWIRQDQKSLQRFVGEDVQEGSTSEGEGDDKVQYEFQLLQRS